MSRQNCPGRALAKVQALCLLLSIALVCTVASTPAASPAKAKHVKVEEEEHEWLVQRLYSEHQKTIEKAAVAALLGGF